MYTVKKSKNFIDKLHKVLQKQSQDSCTIKLIWEHTSGTPLAKKLTQQLLDQWLEQSITRQEDKAGAGEQCKETNEEFQKQTKNLIKGGKKSGK